MSLACHSEATKITRMKRFILAAPLLLALSACSGNEGERSAPQKPVVVLKAYSTTLHDKVEALGTAQASESIAITAKVAGRLETIHFADGQKVDKGDLIVSMDQSEEEAQLAAAAAQLAEHSREIKRLEKLLVSKAASERDLDARKTLAAVTASQIKEIKARIDDLTLRAPFTGRLGIRRISPGALVQPGHIITNLDAADLIKLDFTIPATALSGISPGTRISAYPDTMPGNLFSGEITAMDSHIDPVSRSILARAVFDNKDGKLIPGMLMHVTILQNEREALVVPEEAVTQKQDKHFLTIVGNASAIEIRSVSIGSRQNGLVEIVDGLKTGELVVVRGMSFVKPGQQVSIGETWETIRDSQFPLNDN